MVSIWWLLVAFVGGGTAGILVVALMQMAGDARSNPRRTCLI